MILRYLVALILFVVVVESSRADEPYAGWFHVASRLRSEGIPDTLLRQVYDGETIPPFDFVPFGLKPRETHEMYTGFLAKRIVNLGLDCEERYRDYLNGAEKLFHVEKEVVLAIIVVESHCGQTTGRELVVNRLSRVANVNDPRNLLRNFEKLRNEDPTTKMGEVKDRGAYLERAFFPQLKALFEEHVKGNLDIFTLRGSSAGAFGWGQFLPMTYAKYGVDGDRDGHIALSTPGDAIYSVAHFFAAHGWREDLPDEKRREIIWNYNKSDPYIDTILKLRKSFKAEGR